jgi:hypothetical protein
LAGGNFKKGEPVKVYIYDSTGRSHQIDLSVFPDFTRKAILETLYEIAGPLGLVVLKF